MAAVVDVRRERESLRLISDRWKPRWWRFSPLERIDGRDEVEESLDTLRCSMLTWKELETHFPDVDLPELIDDLGHSFFDAGHPWHELKVIHDPDGVEGDAMRFRNGTYSAAVRRNARERFWELKSTSRFSVNAVPDLEDLQRVNWPSPPITLQHVASLAAMVCIVEAVESLERAVTDLGHDIQKFASQDSARWPAQRRRELEVWMLRELVLSSTEERAFYERKFGEARAYHRHAENWLSHVRALDMARTDAARVEANAQMQRAAEAAAFSDTQRQRAQVPRKGLTPEKVAAYVNSKPGQPRKVVLHAIVQEHGVSERTVERHLRQAKKRNLLT